MSRVEELKLELKIAKQKVKALELELEIRKLCEEVPKQPTYPSPFQPYTPFWYEPSIGDRIYGPGPAVNPFDVTYGKDTATTDTEFKFDGLVLS